jgi:cell division protein FtsW (lipid II flippase)
MVIVVIICLAMENYKLWVKPLFIFFLFSCIFTAIASNRPFYHVLASYANPLGGDGWHRARLIDVAIEHFSEWWLIGYGNEDPGWGPYLGMVHTDLTNEFIATGVRYGILGIIALCAVLTIAFLMLVRTYKKMENIELKSMCWSLGSILFAVVVTWMSVSFFGQLVSLFYCILGIIGSFPYLVLRNYESVFQKQDYPLLMYYPEAR